MEIKSEFFQSIVFISKVIYNLKVSVRTLCILTNEVQSSQASTLVAMLFTVGKFIPDCS